MDKEKLKKYLKKEKKFIGFILIILILCGLLYWGYYGGQIAEKSTKVCEVGIGEDKEGDRILCWKWRKATDCEILINIGIDPANVGVSC